MERSQARCTLREQHVQGQAPGLPHDLAISQAARQPGSQAARQPGSQAARQPGSQAARQPGWQPSDEAISLAIDICMMVSSVAATSAFTE